MNVRYIIEQRVLMEVNTDPQRRCYNGCHYKSEMIFSQWDWLVLDVPFNELEQKLKFWRELGEYSVSVGGRKCEYRVVKITEVEGKEIREVLEL